MNITVLDLKKLSTLDKCMCIPCVSTEFPSAVYRVLQNLYGNIDPITLSNVPMESFFTHDVFDATYLNIKMNNCY